MILDKPQPASLTVGVRVFASPTPTRRKTKSKRANSSESEIQRWPDTVLTFDCETDTTPAQRLLYGYYQVGQWRQEMDGVWRVEVAEEGWFYADDLPTRDPKAFALIQAHAATIRESQPLVEQDRTLLLSRRQFVEQVFYRVGYEAKALIVGFNLPFDLAQLGERWARARVRSRNTRAGGGFSIELVSRPGGAPHPFRPRVVIKHVDRSRAFVQFAGLPPEKEAK